MDLKSKANLTHYSYYIPAQQQTQRKNSIS